jgi:hypothetical protein
MNKLFDLRILLYYRLEKEFEHLAGEIGGIWEGSRFCRRAVGCPETWSEFKLQRNALWESYFAFLALDLFSGSWDRVLD